MFTEALFLIRSRIKSRHTIALCAALFGLYIKTFLKKSFSDKKEANSPTIDIVIPTISKDSALIHEVIESLRRHLLQKINKIYIVSNNTNFIQQFCKENNCVFVDELSVLGYGREAIQYDVAGFDRRGWMLQQLLKLSGEKFVEMENYLVVDSDTLFINDHSFFENGKTLFFQSREWHEYYFRTFENIFGYEAPTKLSFTAHMMLFNTTYLKEMKSEIEKKHGKSWDKVYAATASSTEMSCISDYDTYANWFMHNHPDKMSARPFYNKGLSRAYFTNLSNLEQKYSHKYRSLSFHSYIEK